MAEGKKQAQTHHDNTEKRRKVTSGTYKSFTLQKRIKPVGPGLPSGGKLLRSSLRLLKKKLEAFCWHCGYLRFYKYCAYSDVKQW